MVALQLLAQLEVGFNFGLLLVKSTLQTSVFLLKLLNQGLLVPGSFSHFSVDRLQGLVLRQDCFHFSRVATAILLNSLLQFLSQFFVLFLKQLSLFLNKLKSFFQVSLGLKKLGRNSFPEGEGAGLVEALSLGLQLLQQLYPGEQGLDFSLFGFHALSRLVLLQVQRVFKSLVLVPKLLYFCLLSLHAQLQNLNFVF